LWALRLLVDPFFFALRAVLIRLRFTARLGLALWIAGLVRLVVRHQVILLLSAYAE
jgi:hypothetical protein